MPLPFKNQPEVEAAVEAALEKTGALSPRNSAVEALNESGADVVRLATELANLIFSARDPIKLKAIEKAFALHGINLQPEMSGPTQPVINIVVQGEDVNLQNLFAPERKV